MVDATVSIMQAEDPLVLALDAGTSSVRALVYDARARAVESWEVHRPYDVRTTSDGGVEVDADSMVGLVVDCVDAITTAVTAVHRRIAAVGSDTFWHSLMGVDGSGVAVTPVYTWADTRSARAASELQGRLDIAAVHARTGTVVHSSYWPSKLLWLRQTEPEKVRRVTRWMSLAEYIYLKLFGETRVSVSMASGTGIFDQNHQQWDGEMLRVTGVSEEQLSPLVDISDAYSGLAPPYARRWPALKDVPWYVPVGDGAANNIGSGGGSDDRIVIMIGTSGALRVVRRMDRVQIPEGLWTYRVDRHRFVQGGALSAGGNVFAWAIRSLKLDVVEMLEAEVAALAADGHGLTVLPFLAGERSPDWNVDARSAVVGITLDTSSAELVRALLEAVTYRFGLVYGILRRDLPTVRGIIGSGAGLLRSPVWMQMMTDVLGQPMTASAVPEATSRGAALLALECLGTVPDAARVAAPLGITYEPHAENSEIYRSAMTRQQELYTRLLG